MQKLKLLVISLFAGFALFFFAAGNRADAVSGNSATAAPSAPTGVSASNNDYANKVGVMWDSVRDATIYRIFRNTVNDSLSATDIGTSVANQFYDTSATPGTTYFYWVRGEGSGGSGQLSSAVQGTRGILGESPGPYVPLEPPDAPAGNEITAAKASLGKALFWDEQMSSTRTVSCGTCHRPAEGGSDPRTIIGDIRSRNPGFDGILGNADDVFGSPGVPKNNLDGTYTEAPVFAFRPQVTGRKSPSYLNAGYSLAGLFWDGRATDEFRDPLTNAVVLASGASLESQVIGPPLSDVEMAHGGRDWTQVAARIAESKPLAVAGNVPASLSSWIEGRTYPELFNEAFGSPEVTPARIAMAIATHERQIITDRTPFDRWAAGMGGLTEQEARGALVFIGKQCTECHVGPNFTDDFFHNIGVRPQFEDRGRGAITNNIEDDAKFKTPGLRNVELHAPYMHNGRFATLEDVVEFYDRGGDHDAPNIDRGVIRPMAMTPMEKADLVAFMKRPMTDPRVQAELPPFDRPQLYTESGRVPQVSGDGRAGNGGFVPDAIAIEPPLAGNPSFTVAVARGLGGANATLVIGSSDPGVGASIPTAGSFALQTLALTGTGHGSVSLAIPRSTSGQTFFGRWYVVDGTAANGFSVSRLITFTVFGDGSVVPSGPAAFDFDGDGKTDVSIFRPLGGTGGGEWWYLRSSDGGASGFAFGSQTDTPVPADFTGDGKTDIAFWRESTGEWFVLRSEDFTFFAFPFGAAGDIPMPADFDGDGEADATVFRPSTNTWFTRRSSDGQVTITPFGAAGDLPVAADFDGDGKTDIAVFRPNGGSGAEWWYQRSSDGGSGAYSFGSATDKAVPADFTGDGKADIAFWRPSTGEWYILRSEDDSFYAFPFGVSTDIPVPGDYDGDGKADAAVFRPSNNTWYMQRSTAGFEAIAFGSTGDKPLPNVFVR